MVKIITALIVEDDSLARNDLKRKIKNLSSNTWEVLTASNIEEGVSKIQSMKPDIVFLDVELDGRLCFDLLEEVIEGCRIDLKFVFTSEYMENHWKKAMDFSSLKYLEKPITKGRLSDFMNTFNQKMKDHEMEIRNLQNSILKNLPKLIIRQEGASIVLNIPDIICFEADSNNTRIHHVDPSIPSHVHASKPLKFYDELLSDSEDYQFFRCHQSFFVNKDYILKYHERGKIELRDGLTIKKKNETEPSEYIPVSESRRKMFKKWLGL